MDDVQVELASTPRSVGAARTAVAAALTRWPHLQDTAALLVTELATNAVLHARSAFLVEVHLAGDAVRIAVSDTSAVLPQRKRHGAESSTGRGLGLVALLSSGHGVERRTGGPYRKAVWCDLPLDPAALPRPGEGALLRSA